MPTTASPGEIRHEADFGDTSNEHGTPPALVRLLQEANGGPFTIDPCSGAELSPIADTRFTKSENGLNQHWHGQVYVNPPYDSMPEWVDKILAENDRPATDYILLLCKAPCTSDWFHNAAEEAETLLVFDHRLTFAGNDEAAPFSSCILAFGDVPEPTKQALATQGTLFERDDTYTDVGSQIRFTEYTTEETPQETQELILAQDFGDIPPLYVGDRIQLTINTDAHGTPDVLPESMTVDVVAGCVPDELATPTDRENYDTVRGVTPADQVEVLTYHDPTDTWVLLQDRTDRGFAVSMSEGDLGPGWQVVPVADITWRWHHQTPEENLSEVF